MVRTTLKIEEQHQVQVLAVDVSEDFDWSADAQNHWLFL